MTQPPPRYNPRAIRDLLIAGFNVEGLRSLFSFAANHDLRPVADEFTPEDGKPAMVRKAIEYCRAKYLLDELLAEIRSENPHAYERFEDQLVEREAPAAALVGALPADPGDDLVGRDAEVEEIRRQLDRRGIVVISGMGGVGKTVLAARVACLIAEVEGRCGDAQLYLDLKGSDPDPVEPVDALESLLNAVSKPDPHRPRTLEVLENLWRQAVRGMHALLFLDNAADAAQVRPLLPGSRTCAVLVTSRQRFTLPGAGRLDLYPLGPDEARALLQELAPRIDDVGADEIAELCGRLPLALGVAGNQLDLNDDVTPGAYSRELADERTRLAQLRDPGDPDLDVAAVLSLSVDQLARDDADLHRGWALLSLFPAPFDLGAAAALWGETRKTEPFDVAKVADDVQRQLQDGGLDTEGFDGDLATAIAQALQGLEAQNRSGPAIDTLDEGETRACLQALRNRSLLIYDREADRWLLHDLVRLAGAGSLETLDEGERAEAVLRLARHYEGVARSAKERYNQGGEGILVGLSLFDREWPHIRAGQAWAAAHAAEDDDAAWLCSQYVDSASEFLALGAMPSYWIDRLHLPPDAAPNLVGERLSPHAWIEWLEPALEAARRLGDREGEGVHLGNLGLAYKNLGEMEQAVDYYQQAIALAHEINDRRNEAVHLGNLGNVYLLLGNSEEAIDVLQQALSLAREIGDRLGEAHWMGSLGLAYQNQGEIGRAVDQFQQALQLHEGVGDRLNQGRDLSNLGNSYYRLGETEQAIEHFRRSLAIAQEMGDPRAGGEVLANLGLIYRQQDDVVWAREYWDQALELFEGIGDPRAEQVRAWLAALG